MGLSNFSANLEYISGDGCEYQTTFCVNPKAPDANKVLLDALEHLAWMGSVGGQSNATKEAFERGHARGVERRAYLDSLNKESEA